MDECKANHKADNDEVERYFQLTPGEWNLIMITRGLKVDPWKLGESITRNWLSSNVSRKRDELEK